MIEVLPPTLFRSFWMGGFEGASHKLCSGERINMIAVTQHDRQVAQDYQVLSSLGITTVRESLSWHLIDCRTHFDFSSLLSRLQASKASQTQVIWSLCHYGWPDDLDIFSGAFVDRFARYCGEVARLIAGQADEIAFYNPINELSFLAWAVGNAGFIYPCLHDRSVEFKQQLIRASIAGCEAIWENDPRARIIHTDPIMQIIAPLGHPDLARHALDETNSQFEAWDMLGGWYQPELGGHPRYLDIIAVNYYHDNQWELERKRLSWEERLASGDKRWLPAHVLIENVYNRYLRPIFIGESSHFGAGRGPWIRMIAQEVRQARMNGVPVEGICLYPVIDRPAWHDPNHWHNSGLLDVLQTDDGELKRVLNQPYLEDLQWAQKYLAD